MKMVNQALKIFSNPENGTMEPTYDPVTNTRFIYKYDLINFILIELNLHSVYLIVNLKYELGYLGCHFKVHKSILT